MTSDHVTPFLSEHGMSEEYHAAMLRAGGLHQSLLARTLSQVFTCELFLRNFLGADMAADNAWAQAAVDDLLLRADLSRKITLMDGLLEQRGDESGVRQLVTSQLRALNDLRNRLAHSALIAHDDETQLILVGRARTGVTKIVLTAEEVESTLAGAERALGALAERFLPAPEPRATTQWPQLQPRSPDLTDAVQRARQ